MIDPAHRMAASLINKGLFTKRVGRTKGGLNSKLYAVCDDQGRLVVLMLSEDQMSDYKGAALMLKALPPANESLNNRGYDADWFRKALDERGIAACIPGRSNRKTSIGYGRKLYR